MKGFHQKAESMRNADFGRERALFTTRWKGKCRNCGKLAHKSAQCKSKMVRDEKPVETWSYLQLLEEVRPSQVQLLWVIKKESSWRQLCWNKKWNAGSATNVVLTTVTTNDGIDNTIWIGDSGASCHYCNSEEGLYNYTTISEEITVGNGNKMLAKKVGSLKCTVQPKKLW
jgi:hypothetical protein